MKKKISKQIYPWIWKWHFIGGMISAPIVILLAITGLIYLFKDSYEAPQKQIMMRIEQKTDSKMSFQQQWELVQTAWQDAPTSIVVPRSENETTEFISGKFDQKSTVYVDPYSQKVTGMVHVHETDMYSVRKLHGELLLGSYGTKVVELVACWMIVLIITGVFLFWPRGRSWKAFFTIRTGQNKRVLYRDLHAILGFWFSFLLLLVLAGALPWTDVFGANLKWVQQKTNTGYPATWSGTTLRSKPVGRNISLDDVISKAKSLQLTGKTMVDLPQSPTSVYSVYNQTNVLSSTKMIHLDQYSGEVLVSHTWDDIGVLMKGRLWTMAFHQGEFGLWNWCLMFLIAIGLFILSLSALITYFYRKKPGTLSIPKVPDDFSLSIVLVIIIIILGVVLPLFGVSVVFIFLVSTFKMISNKILRL
ncbi:PepSY domain-containing protein [Sphingobacterium sp. lm-10]|uniref:PepSY-associated TM helix domain-containing protein n=1 Tax=Sphingobacterium sp. lm-10 TaxID=2944904 RepID=UPI0020210D44|nr:PepSY domain-containing protein [Sphingobacterium sp. lm-10]MCL7988468.1 PepSY domain-containing protein [Sphingobacterium sp. lm-10]